MKFKLEWILMGVSFVLMLLIIFLNFAIFLDNRCTDSYTEIIDFEEYDCFRYRGDKICCKTDYSYQSRNMSNLIWYDIFDCYKFSRSD